MPQGWHEPRRGHNRLTARFRPFRNLKASAPEPLHNVDIHTLVSGNIRFCGHTLNVEFVLTIGEPERRQTARDWIMLE